MNLSKANAIEELESAIEKIKNLPDDCQPIIIVVQHDSGTGYYKKDIHCLQVKQ